MKTLLLAAALALVPAGTSAQSAPAAPAPATAPASQVPLPDANPALWVVRDDDTTIYLFGTFHLLDGRPWFDDEVRTAFDASSEVVLEAIIPENPAELQPLIVQYALDPQGRSLSTLLSAEQNAALGRALQTLGAPPNAFDRFEPWFVAMSMTAVAAQQMGISSDNGPEGVITRAARARNIPVSELEGIEWQLRLFDGMPEELQLKQLRQSLDELDQIRETLQPMLAAWSDGDVERLQRIMEQSGDRDPALLQFLITNRNRTWAGWIQDRMSRPGVVFLAVGAAHLTGNDSVQNLLRARGLRAERVPHVETPAPS